MEAECWGFELPTGAVFIIEQDEEGPGPELPFVVIYHDGRAQALTVDDVLSPDPSLPRNVKFDSTTPSQNNQSGVLNVVGHHYDRSKK